MSLPTVQLKPQRPDRLGHPWVYDNEVASGPDAGFEDGGLVRVLDARGRTLGVGYLNRRSKIALRYLTRRADETVDAGFWRGRVQAAYAYRQARYASRGGPPPAYRLVHGEADGLPGLVVDVYPEHAVCQFLALGLEPWRDALIKAIADTLGVRGIYERSDSPVRRLEGLEERTGALWGLEPPDVLEWEDNGATVLADLKTGAKTGLFLDQRDNQAAAASEAEGRSVLNCFSYTGLFGLRAARAGSRGVTDVETSAAFNALNKRQWAANGLTQSHAVIGENVFDYLHTLEREAYKTDMVVLDPPAFTKNRASREGAFRGYHEINRLALRLLRSGGVLVTCSCSHHLSLEEFRDVVAGAARDARRDLRLIAARGQPPDHPVLMSAPESEYLKCLLLSVE